MYVVPKIITIDFLCRVLNTLLSQAITEEEYVVTQHIPEASIVITNTKEPPLTLTIHLTSPLVREDVEKALSGGKPRHPRAPVLLEHRLLRAGRPGRQPGEIDIVYWAFNGAGGTRMHRHVMKLGYA